MYVQFVLRSASLLSDGNVSYVFLAYTAHSRAARVVDTLQLEVFGEERVYAYFPYLLALVTQVLYSPTRYSSYQLLCFETCGFFLFVLGYHFFATTGTTLSVCFILFFLSVLSNLYFFILFTLGCSRKCTKKTADSNTNLSNPTANIYFHEFVCHMPILIRNHRDIVFRDVDDGSFEASLRGYRQVCEQMRSKTNMQAYHDTQLLKSLLSAVSAHRTDSTWNGTVMRFVCFLNIPRFSGRCMRLCLQLSFRDHTCR